MVESKFISIVEYNDDTGRLKIRTAYLPAEKADDLCREFLDPTKPIAQTPHVYAGKQGDVIPYIEIDTRSGNGVSNTVVELRGVETQNYRISNLIKTMSPNDVTYSPLSEEGVGRVIYSVQSGREVSRTIALSPDAKPDKKHFDEVSGQRLVFSPEHQFGQETEELGRTAPHASGEDITQLMQTISRQGRNLEKSRYGLETEILGKTTQGIFDVDSLGFPTTDHEGHSRLHFNNHKVAHVKIMVMQTSELLASFPWLKDIAPTGMDEEAPSNAARKAPARQPPAFVR